METMKYLMHLFRDEDTTSKISTMPVSMEEAILSSYCQKHKLIIDKDARFSLIQITGITGK